jgi:aspartyl-tRNA synthetase
MNRTYTIDTLNKIDQHVDLYGWVDTVRDHGKITFIDVRDITGKLQCVYMGKMDLTPESVVHVAGKIKKRPEKLVNPKIATGEIELEITFYEVLNRSRELPLPIDNDGLDINEEVRLRYRYLDLRRERMHKIIKLRSELTRAFRDALYNRNFIEVETPLLTKATKEGARNFVVPSRYSAGKFYALPQSPQQYKQLLMTAGFERYFQIARCIRDEDPRADRGYEFTQVDLEMSFVDRDEAMRHIQDIVIEAVAKVGAKIKDMDFPVIDYRDAVTKYGADKFDLRNDEEKEQNVLAFAWVVNFPFFKKVDAADAAEREDSKSGWTFTHNPFSIPLKDHESWLLEGKNIGDILTTQYDLVCNGFEVGGGSIRAHRPELLRAVYAVMGYSDEQIAENIGHMLEAFELGTPPHGGIALGFDRIVMIMAGERSLKETIAFPMTATGRTSVMDAPCDIQEEQLRELHLKVVEKSK